MAFNVPPVGGGDRIGGPVPTPPRASEAADGKDFSKVLSKEGDVRVDTLPAGPPPELKAEVERASARQDELRAQGRQIHFGSDPSSGRLVIEVHDLEGNVVGTLPPSKALDVISGAPLED
jgi:hypothetical protein